jgi:uncharacterized protein
VNVRHLTASERPALEALLLREPASNAFHLSALAEHGLAPVAEAHGRTWAVGAYRNDELAGAVVALRGTGGIYHAPGDEETLRALAGTVVEKSTEGALSLISAHATQVEPLLPLIKRAANLHYDTCHFVTLVPGDLTEPEDIAGFGVPRFATAADMERLIDFYMIGFYSLARLPSRQAWHSRLSEQLAYRTLFLVEDEQGRVASAALTSAETPAAAMLGGVATLPQHRGKGLSTICVGALCERLFRSGVQRVSLFYLKGNDSAGRVYEKLGFHDAGEWLLVPLGFPLYTSAW